MALEAQKVWYYTPLENRRCKTCKWWKLETDENSLEFNFRAVQICRPDDPDTDLPMDRGFETRECIQPTQTFYEPPVESDGFGLCDGSQYGATLFTAENFGCVKHERIENDSADTQTA